MSIFGLYIVPNITILYSLYVQIWIEIIMHANCILRCFLTFRENGEASENSIVALKKSENHRDLGSFKSQPTSDDNTAGKRFFGSSRV